MVKKNIWLNKSDIGKRLLVVFLLALIVLVVLIVFLNGKDDVKLSDSPPVGELTVQDKVSLERLNTNLKEAQNYLTDAERDVANLENKLEIARAKLVQGQREVDQIEDNIGEITEKNEVVNEDDTVEDSK